jgi:hypothetical protein
MYLYNNASVFHLCEIYTDQFCVILSHVQEIIVLAVHVCNIYVDIILLVSSRTKYTTTGPLILKVVTLELSGMERFFLLRSLVIRFLPVLVYHFGDRWQNIAFIRLSSNFILGISH